MASDDLDPEFGAANSTALADLLLTFLEQALDLAASRDRDARLAELGDLLEGARDAQRLLLRIAPKL